MKLVSFCLAGSLFALLAACGTNAPSELKQVQSLGDTFTRTVKTQVALYEGSHSLTDDQTAKVTIALNSLNAANVVLQGLTSDVTLSSGLNEAQVVVAAAQSVVNALPTGTIPQDALDQINTDATIFEVAAGLAQQVIVAVGK